MDEPWKPNWVVLCQNPVCPRPYYVTFEQKPPESIYKGRTAICPQCGEKLRLRSLRRIAQKKTP